MGSIMTANDFVKKLNEEFGLDFSGVMSVNLIVNPGMPVTLSVTLAMTSEDTNEIMESIAKDYLLVERGS
jgi:hypothetical protein